ncbi:MAG: DNA-binding protein [Deltaproteobacteria bacterium]|nr:DNA-binding protein [Deltaproteobacteria bacterium]
MNITPEIERRIASFVADLDGLVRSAALEAVQAALSGKAPAAKAPAAVATKAPKPVAAKAPVARKSKGGKRDPKDLAKLVDTVEAHIAKNSGHGVETIAKYLNVSTKDLALPIIKLLDAKKITRKGQRRGTRYFAAK